MPTVSSVIIFSKSFLSTPSKAKIKKKHIEISLLSKELATLQIAMPPSAP
jgi:hypothetical protein